MKKKPVKEPKERDAQKMIVGRRTTGVGPHADKTKSKGGSKNWKKLLEESDE